MIYLERLLSAYGLDTEEARIKFIRHTQAGYDFDELWRAGLLEQYQAFQSNRTAATRSFAT